jgi:hypothetical protein
MIDETRGFENFQAILKAQRLRGWAAHNEFDYFKLCPACGHWFDCRTSESLMKHKCATRPDIVVTTIAQTFTDTISVSTIAAETPDFPKIPTGGAKP